jgi:hypothetical protein
LVDAPYLNLTPGTRSGIIQDEAYQRLVSELAPVETELLRIIADQQRAEEEQTSRHVLRSIQRAFKEALLALPAEEYDWFDLHDRNGKKGAKGSSVAPDSMEAEVPTEDASVPQVLQEEPAQKQFFDYCGPLFSVRISPTSSVIPAGGTKNLRAIARDRANRLVEQDLVFAWEIFEGDGVLANAHGEIVSFAAPAEPGLTRVRVIARQGTTACSAEALVTVTQTLIPEPPAHAGIKQGLPSYTFQKAPGELWRSRYQADQNVVVINNGHRDFVYASRNKALKVRYVCRLFAKELVMRNFSGLAADELLERLIELSLYTEENLK